MKIQRKIIAVIYAVIFPVLGIVMLMFGILSARTETEKNYEQYISRVSSAGFNLATIYNEINTFSYYFSVNNDVQRILNTSDAGGYTPFFWQNEAKVGAIRDMLVLSGEITSLVLYPENGLPAYSCTRDASVFSEDFSQIRQLGLYTRTVAKLGDTLLTAVEQDETGVFGVNKKRRIAFTRELFDLSKNTRLAFLAIFIDSSVLTRISQYVQTFDTETVVILSEDGEPLSRYGTVADETVQSAAAQLREASQGSGALNLDAYRVFYSQVKHGFTILYFSPNQLWSAAASRNTLSLALIGISMLVGVFPISYMLGRYITSPIAKLHKSMIRFRKGDFTEQVEVSTSQDHSKDEIAELSSEFNRMVKSIQELINTRYLLELRDNESQLNALQAQINPHFLYNALDALYWKSTSLGAEDLAEDVLALSNLFRLLLSQGRRLVMVEEEIAIIRNYMHIQKTRFGKRLSYQIDIDPSITSCPIPKLTLQPFVENANVHGLEKSDAQVLIRISGWQEAGMLHFLVTDNGIGMPQEKVDEIMRGERAASEADCLDQQIGNFGIRNVMDRLRLYYKGNDSLEIHSALGEGTSVHISIPKVCEPSA
jgi:two-component system sensor histidine kinase YesM